MRVPADDALSQKTIGLIPFVMLLHFLMGIWSHTADGVFVDEAYVVKFANPMLEARGDLVKRAFVDILMLGGAAIIFAWIVFDYTVVKFFTTLVECFKDEIEVPK